jgi:hypothetical protein
MRLLSPVCRIWQGRIAEPSKRKDLPPPGSNFAIALALIAAVGLALSSAGFGALFAWHSTIGHGPVMAALTVLFAIALEACKPLAVSSAFSAFRSWAVVRGLALSALATVAVAYSLTAELSLIAGSRGDLVAKREAVIESHDDRRRSWTHSRGRAVSWKTPLSAASPD